MVLRMARTSLKEIIHKMVVKDRIQRVYALCAAETVALKQYKRKHGYCGGSPSCMEYTGESALCRRCRHSKDHPRYKKPVYEYGQLRAKEREQERAHPERKKAVPKRKAA